MTDSEFIKYLINIIDQKGSKNISSDDTENYDDDEYEDDDTSIDSLSNKSINITINDRTDPKDIKSPIDGAKIFIPPLQQRIEMLKKLSGVTPDNQDSMASTSGDDPTDD
jgi:hypothetical protein